MSRLIDAEFFKEQIASATLKNNIEPNKGLGLIELVDAQPTAYVVENVIREINDDIAHIVPDDTNESFVQYEGVINAIRKGGLEYE